MSLGIVLLLVGWAALALVWLALLVAHGRREQTRTP